MELDWNERLKAMRFHSALHLLAGVFESAFGKRAVAGAIKEKENQAYLVFKEEISDEIINKAIECTNKNIFIKMADIILGGRIWRMPESGI